MWKRKNSHGNDAHEGHEMNEELKRKYLKKVMEDYEARTPVEELPREVKQTEVEKRQEQGWYWPNKKGVVEKWTPTPEVVTSIKEAIKRQREKKNI